MSDAERDLERRALLHDAARERARRLAERLALVRLAVERAGGVAIFPPHLRRVVEHALEGPR